MSKGSLKITNEGVALLLNYNSLEEAKGKPKPLLIEQTADGELVELSLEQARWLKCALEDYIEMLK